MRQLFTTLHPIADKLTSILAAKVPTDGCMCYSHILKSSLIVPYGTAYKEVDVLPWLSRCALDGVCQGILGYPSNSLSIAENDAYTEALRMMGYVHSFCTFRLMS